MAHDHLPGFRIPHPFFEETEAAQAAGKHVPMVPLEPEPYAEPDDCSPRGLIEVSDTTKRHPTCHENKTVATVPESWVRIYLPLRRRSSS